MTGMTTDIKHRTASDQRPVALVTGGSAGLGRALTRALVERGWRVVTDARHSDALAGVRGPEVVTVTGDLTASEHRGRLLAAVEDAGRLDLLVHNASTLGRTPMRPLDQAGAGDASRVWRTNVDAPLQLTRDLMSALARTNGTLVSISSDAAVAHYPTWGLYGATKAALDHITLTFAAENPGITAYSVDPGDMRTAMHQAAFPDEDISDRPLPEAVVPRILGLLEARPASGRYRAVDLPSVPSMAAATGAPGVAR